MALSSQRAGTAAESSPGNQSGRSAPDRGRLRIAAGRPIIFKLHPAEQHARATHEIRALVPDALILTDGNTEHMIANCAAVVAQYSTVAFTAAALGKEVHSYIDPALLQRILPIQNGGTSAAHIADVCRGVLESSPADVQRVRSLVEPRVFQSVQPSEVG